MASAPGTLRTDASLELQTARLSLIACPLAVADALGNDRAQAARMLDVAFPDDWPDTELAELLPLYAERLRDDPGGLGYGTWLLVERSSRMIVGSAGFLGSPTIEGTVEIGYGVHDAYRKRGYATEAARALVAWALGQDGVVRVTARCRPANAASIGVLRRAGLEQTDEVDGLTHWITP